MKQKRCAELHIPHNNPQTHYTTGVWSLIQLASLYTVPLSDVNGLSRLTKLTTSKGAGTADSIRKLLNQPIPFESNRTADLNSNRISKLHTSQVPIINVLMISTVAGLLQQWWECIQGGPKKTKLSFFVHIFAKYWPICTIFSPVDSVRNLLLTNMHTTPTMSLHYLVKHI